MKPEWRTKRLERLTSQLPLASSTKNLSPELADLEWRLSSEEDMSDEEVDAIIGRIVAFYVEEPAAPATAPAYLPRP